MIKPCEPIYPASAIRHIEKCVTIDTPSVSLMERAGRAAAEKAFRLTENSDGAILVICGPGNNGGDGFAMARRLKEANKEVVVVFADDPSKLPPDAASTYQSWLDCGGTIQTTLPQHDECCWALIVDALFGIGLERPLADPHKSWIEKINHDFSAPCLALDIPSGLHADTGRILGVACQAQYTLSFIALKPGLLTLDGPDYVGELDIHPLDISREDILPANGQLIHPDLFHSKLQPRKRNSHKGLFGEAGIIGGAKGMVGAALLTSQATIMLGAGRVFMHCLDPNAPAVNIAQPEIMLCSANEVLKQASALAIGPGMGHHSTARNLLHKSISLPLPLLLDADALNILSQSSSLQKKLAARRHPTLLTPHPGEAARLLNISIEAVQDDRICAALDLAQKYQAYTLLKGMGSIISTPRGDWFINCSGHPGMASAGMGDALTGLILALLSQGWSAKEALTAAVHLHGVAADHLASDGIGPIGLTASEIIPAAREVFNTWIISARKSS